MKLIATATCKCENKRNHQQWQCTVEDITEHGPVVPVEVVMTALKMGTEALQPDASAAITESAAAVASDNMSFAEEGSLELTLTLKLTPIWSPEFIFFLRPVKLEPLDVVAATLRDAQDEITLLRNELAHLKSSRSSGPIYLTVSSKTACGNQQIIQWDDVAHQKFSVENFSISSDFRTITIMRSGAYQVNVRIGQTNNANTQFLSLLVDGTVVAGSVASDSGNHQETVQLSEILVLDEGSELTVKCGANGNSLGNALLNRFWILMLN